MISEGPCLLDVSPKLQRFLGVQTQSVPLSSIISSTSDSFKHLLGIACIDSVVDEDNLPTIITCRTHDQMECEVRVFPFRPPGGELKLCFHLASEKRGILRCPEHSALYDPDIDKSEEAAPSLSSLAVSQSISIAAAAMPVEKHSVGTQTSAVWTLPPTPVQGSAATRQRDAYRAPVILKTRKVILPEFAVTPAATMRHLVFNVLRRCNPRGKGCCAWHIGLQTLLRLALDSSTSECNRDFRPYRGWQCRGCFALHLADESLTCRVCNSARPFGYRRNVLAPSPDPSSSSAAGTGDSE